MPRMLREAGGQDPQRSNTNEYDMSVQKCLVAFQLKDSFTLRHHSPMK